MTCGDPEATILGKIAGERKGYRPGFNNGVKIATALGREIGL